MAEGWISIHRKIQDCWIWTDEEFSKGQAWVDLLLLVNHKDTKIPFNGEFITVKAGQRITSIASLAERWKWSRHKVSDFLNILEKDEMITQIRDNKKTLITIVNFEVYQNGDVIEGHQKDIKRTQTIMIIMRIMKINLMSMLKLMNGLSNSIPIIQKRKKESPKLFKRFVCY